jgi:hypothetical protein
MVALLIAGGALLIAVIGCALLDPCEGRGLGGRTPWLQRSAQPLYRGVVSDQGRRSVIVERAAALQCIAITGHIRLAAL